MNDPKIPNTWELYSSMDGWKSVSRKLDEAFEAAVINMDKAIREDGVSIQAAAELAFGAVEKVMSEFDNVQFGASDSEPRMVLAEKLSNHVKKNFDVSDSFYVDRFGDVGGVSTSWSP